MQSALHCMTDDVSMDSPFLMAQMEAPLPICITMRLVLSAGLLKNCATDRRMKE